MARLAGRRAPRPSAAGAAVPVAAVLAGAAAATTLGLQATPAHAAFSLTTGNGGNSFAARADFVAPDAGAVTIAKTSPAGYLGGAVRPSNGYQVHAAVTDTGNPASGVASVTADVSTVTAGQTAAALTAASASVQGVVYSHRSATLTAGASTGSRGYAVTMTDAAANARTRTGYTVLVDGTAPAASDVQATNTSGGTVGRPDAGDTLSLTYSEQVDPFSVLAGWTGSGQAVTLRFTRVNGANSALSVLTTGGATLPLGSVAVGVTWLNSSFDVPATMTQSGSRIDVVLGTVPVSPTTNGSSSLSWTPTSTTFDAAGNPTGTATFTESGAADADF